MQFFRSGLAVTAVSYLMSAGFALAGHDHDVRSVPEIDASAGLTAIAAVLAALALVWERNRRARKA